MTISLVGYDKVSLAPKGCNKCGSKTVAWKLAKSGKWYLIEAFIFDGEWRSNYKEFHSGYCKKIELHNVKQAQILDALGLEEEQKEEFFNRDDLAIMVEERTAAQEAEYFLKLHDMCKQDPELAIDEIAMREAAKRMSSPQGKQRLQAEIDFMRAALGVTS